MVIFTQEDGSVSVQVDAVNETIWMNQKGMAELFGVDKSSISRHLKNIFEEGELDEKVVVANFATTTQHGAIDGKTQTTHTQFYNLDAIIAVGYRVNSKTATQFRIWATKVLREYIVKGYTLDAERFKKGQSLTYFKELLEKIREIRLSERLFYQQIKDIYALSVDYDPSAKRTQEFFAKVQNKLLWAVSKHTAAELMAYRGDPSKPLMGLTSTETQGVVKTTDVVIGKNYLNESELNNLKLLVEQFLAFAEAQANNHVSMTMTDWEKNLDIILTMNGRELLNNAGSISKALAEQTAKAHLVQYKERMREEERLESIRELDRDLKALNKITPQ